MESINNHPNTHILHKVEFISMEDKIIDYQLGLYIDALLWDHLISDIEEVVEIGIKTEED